MAERIVAEMTANVWKVLVSEGDQVTPDQELVVLESMKMEIPVLAETGGTVDAVLVKEGDSVAEGDPLIVLGT